MRRALKLHPDCRCDAVEGIEVEIGRQSGAQLRLRYVTTGKIGDIFLPAPADPERTDDLWQHTCFEAFVQRPAAEAMYYEYNFSPSTRWAVYRFEAYRAGRDLSEPAPRVEGRRGERHYEMHVAFDLPVAPPWRMGLAAVIEETNGRKSYWALRHPPGKPDFHHADGFVLELP